MTVEPRGTRGTLGHFSPVLPVFPVVLFPSGPLGGADCRQIELAPCPPSPPPVTRMGVVGRIFTPKKPPLWINGLHCAPTQTHT
jgi:hypothetical protein